MIELVPLGELGEVVSGSTPKTHVAAYWDGDIPWITPADLSQNRDTYCRGNLRKITRAGFNSCSTRMLPAGSILFSSRAPIGHCAIAAYPLCTNQGFKSIIPNQRLDSVYGYYALRYMTPVIVALGRGATFAEINKETFESVRIPVPALDEQKRLAALLDKADRLLRSRRYVQELSNGFLQSVFLEMFGSWDYPYYPLRDLSKDERGAFVNGPFGSNLLTSELTSSGVPVIYIRDIVSGAYKRVSMVCVTDQKATELDVCKVFPSDVLVTKVGDPPGTAAVYPESEPMGVITQDVIRIRVNRSLVTPEYLSTFLNSCKGYQTLEPIIVEGTRARFSLTSYKELPIPVPPLMLQNSFSNVVRRYGRIRAQQREADRQAEHLFQTLLHRSFSDVSGTL